MTMHPALERAIALFVKKEKRERMHALAKRRGDLRDSMLHDRRSLDPAVLLACPETPATTVVAMRAKGAVGVAYCFADDENDDREMPLNEAVSAAFGRARDTLVIAGDVAFYENHEGERFLLWRKPSV